MLTSGKTTIARILQEKLKQAGIPTISRYARHRFLNNVYSIWLSPKYIKSLFTVNHLLKKYAIPQNRKARLSFSFFSRMYTHFLQDESGVLVIDQGLIQSLLSILHIYPVLDDTWLDQLLLQSGICKENILIVNVNCDPKAVKERIVARHKTSCRIDCLSEDEMDSAIRAQKKSLEIIRERFRTCYPGIRSVEIDSSMSPEENAILLFDNLAMQ